VSLVAPRDSDDPLDMGDVCIVSAPPLAELRAEVHRLTAGYGGRGWRYHDRRFMVLSHGRLHIFEKRSSSKVKTVVDVTSDIDECTLRRGGILALTFCRPVEGSSREEGMTEHKAYAFEFASKRVAAQFYSEIARLRMQEGVQIA